MAVYFDHNASHPLLPSVRERLAEAIFQEDPSLGNPASIHRKGQRAKKMVAELRSLLCEFLGRGDGDEFVFTSGATEALNLGLRGFVEERESLNQAWALITSTTEHSAVLDTLQDLQARDPRRDLTYLGVKSDASLQVEGLTELVGQKISQQKDVLLVLQICNNETGAYFSLPEILAPLMAAYGPSSQFSKAAGSVAKNPRRSPRLWVMIDAAQALGKMPESYLRSVLHFSDYMALSGHKMGAPQGIGALWLRADAPLRSQITGGNQERKRRAGTFNSLGALGWKYALEDWKALGDVYRSRLYELREYLRLRMAKIPGLHFHGDWNSADPRQICNTLNFHVEACPEESLLLALDVAGFELSSGSACHSGSLKASRVLLAMGYPESVALSSLRLSLGTENTPTQVETFLEVLREKIDHIRKAREESRRLLPHLEMETE